MRIALVTAALMAASAPIQPTLGQPISPPTITNSIGMELVLIHPGTLLVGRFEPACPSPSDPGSADQDPRARWTRADTARCEEIVQRERRSGFTVTLPHPYYIGKYEVRS